MRPPAPRSLAGLALAGLALAAPAARAAPPAQPPLFGVGVDGFVGLEHYLGLGVELELARRIGPALWGHATFAYGAATLYDPAGSGQGANQLRGGRLGVTWLPCARTACGGLRAGLGFQQIAIDFSDGLVDPPDWTERLDTVFAQGDLVGRLRLYGDSVAFQATLGARLGVATHHDHVDGGLQRGLVVTAGLRVVL